MGNDPCMSAFMVGLQKEKSPAKLAHLLMAEMRKGKAAARKPQSTDSLPADSWPKAPAIWEACLASSSLANNCCSAPDSQAAQRQNSNE
jgi:hypothetical protein